MGVDSSPRWGVGRMNGWGLRFPHKAFVSLPNQPVGGGMYLAGTEPEPAITLPGNPLLAEIPLPTAIHFLLVHFLGEVGFYFIPFHCGY